MINRNISTEFVLLSKDLRVQISGAVLEDMKDFLKQRMRVTFSYMPGDCIEVLNNSIEVKVSNLNKAVSQKNKIYEEEGLSVNKNLVKKKV